MVDKNTPAGCNAATTTCSLTLTTTSPQAEIIDCIAEWSNAGTSPTMSGGSLTWIQRGSSVHSATGGIWGGEFEAVASSPLSAASLTFTATSAVTVSATCFGISSENGFDSHSGLPFSGTGSSTSAPAVSSISTTNTNDILLALLAESGTGQSACPTNFFAIAVGSGGVGGTRTQACYEIVTSPQASITVTWPTDVQASAFVDAVVAASS